ncbi:MAG: 50S ribosomal protein L25 [Solirubrobacteraceae bacterium]|nr:50S ribosomal protein L25 [Solirubrobacteraceae bacterium]
MSTNATSLAVETRDPQHSRDARRARRAGRVPGVVYGGGEPPLTISADARELRNRLAGAGAVIELTVDGGRVEPVVLKEAQRHPVRGELVHVDLLRVDLKQAIQQPVPLEITGAESSPGVREGGIVEHVLREVIVEALPNEIPELLTVSVAELELGLSLTLEAAEVPEGVTIVDDLESVVVNIAVPRAVLSSDGEDDESAVEGEAAAEEPAGE